MARSGRFKFIDGCNVARTISDGQQGFQRDIAFNRTFSDGLEQVCLRLTSIDCGNTNKTAIIYMSTRTTYIEIDYSERGKQMTAIGNKFKYPCTNIRSGPSGTTFKSKSSSETLHSAGLSIANVEIRRGTSCFRSLSN